MISMVQSTVYKFLYLMKNKIIHLVHRAQFYELCGGREHLASYHKIQQTITVQILFSFHLKYLDSQKLPFFSKSLYFSAWPFAISSKDFCPCFHIYICVVTGLLQQTKLKQRSGAQGKAENCQVLLPFQCLIVSGSNQICNSPAACARGS